MPGELSILNCRKGDIRVVISPDDPASTVRAKRMIEDMLKRGYLLAIDVGNGKLEPVQKFDSSTNEYVIIEGALYPGSPDPEPIGEESKPEPIKGKRGEGRPRRIPMDEAKVIGVPPTGGG